MDTIEFKKGRQQYANDEKFTDVVEIFINGKNFLDNIHSYEENCGINGGHAPITFSELYDSLAELYKEDSVPIYGCGCGYIDCCPIYISIDVGEKVVTLYDFEFPDEYGEMKIKSRPAFGKFVFDKKQYFNEIAKLKHWTFGNSATIEYGDIDCGEIKLILKKGGEIFNFWFDDLLGDPIPDIVRLLNFVQSGENLSKHTDIGTFYNPLILEFGENDLEFECNTEKRELEFQISAWHCGANKVRLSFKIYYKPIYGKQITFIDIYLRDELTEMLKKILSDLLNDKKFPYIYPLYYRYDEVSFDEVANLVDIKVKKITNLTDEEKNLKEAELLLQMLKEGKVKLCDAYKIFIDKYKRMLTEYKIPKKWFK